MIEIILTAEEIALAKRLTAQHIANAKQMNAKNYFEIDRSEYDKLFPSKMAEVAVAKATGLPHNGSLSFKEPDVGGYEIKSTPNGTAPYIFIPKRYEIRFDIVFVTTETIERPRLIGWLTREQALETEISNPVWLKYPARIYCRDRLNPIEELPEIKARAQDTRGAATHPPYFAKNARRICFRNLLPELDRLLPGFPVTRL